VLLGDLRTTREPAVILASRLIDGNFGAHPLAANEGEIVSVDLEDFEFAVAERFHTRFADTTHISARTPRELAAALAADSPEHDMQVLITARAFYRIRRWLADVLDIDARSITPSTPCAELLRDKVIRRIVWNHLLELLQIRPAPGLYRPRLITWPIAILACATGLAAMSAIGTLVGPGSFGVLAGATTAMVTTWSLLRLTRVWAYDFLPAGLNVGALAHYAVAYGSPILGDLAQPANRSHTLEVIQSLAYLEIGASHAHPDATWAEL
jgi:hypothetical protein